MSIDVNQLKFTKLDYTGVLKLVSWAKDEGWNPGPYDAEVFYAADPDGFYGYYFNDELIAGGSIVSYDGKFGFMGFFIVKPEFRSAGIGKVLWHQRRDLLLTRLENGAAIGMDGVVAMQPFYERGGFKKAFVDERYLRLGSSSQISPEVEIICEEDFNKILEYDIRCFGFNREKFLKKWLYLPESFAFTFKTGNELKGFALIRKANEGYKIGPLFADDINIAEELYKACLNSRRKEKIYLDIPLTNNDAVTLVKKYEAEPVFQCARMYYNNPPLLPINKIFGITSFELG